MTTSTITRVAKTAFLGTFICSVLFVEEPTAAQSVDRHLKEQVDDKDQALKLLEKEGQLFVERMANEGRPLKEAADFIWVPGLIMQQIQNRATPPLFPVFDSTLRKLKVPLEKGETGSASGPEEGVELDYVVSVRIIGKGCVNIGFVRYQIAHDKMRFEHIWSEPLFEVTAYPALAFDLTGFFDSSTQTAHLHDYFRKRITQTPQSFEVSTRTPSIRVSSFSRYSLKDLAAFPIFAQPKRSVPPGDITRTDRSLTDELALRANAKGQIIEAIRRRGNTELDLTTYGYESGRLKKMGVVLAPRKINHKVSLDMRTVLREAKGLRAEGGLNPDLIVDPDVRQFQMTETVIESPPGGRVAEIDFQTIDIGGTPTTVASEIRLNSGTVDVRRIQTICCARLIGARGLTDQFDDLKIKTYTGEMPPIQAARFILRTAWKNYFRGSDAEAAMETILSTIGPNSSRHEQGNTSSLDREIELLAAASMNLLAKVYRAEPDTAAAALEEWMSKAGDLKLEPWVPELLNTLLSAASRQGDQNTYEELVKGSGRLLAENPHPQILDGLLNSRTQTRTPTALWAISKHYFAANATQLPERQLRQVFLQASLLPSIRRELAKNIGPTEKNNSAYATPDIILAHRTFPTSTLATIAQSLKEKANNAFDQLTRAQQADWSRDLHAIHAWAGK